MIVRIWEYHRKLKNGTDSWRKNTKWIEDLRKNWEHPDYSIVENGRNNEKSSRKLKRLAITWTSVKASKYNWWEKLVLSKMINQFYLIDFYWPAVTFWWAITSSFYIFYASVSLEKTESLVGSSSLMGPLPNYLLCIFLDQIMKLQLILFSYLFSTGWEKIIG